MLEFTFSLPAAALQQEAQMSPDSAALLPLAGRAGGREDGGKGQWAWHMCGRGRFVGVADCWLGILKWAHSPPRTGRIESMGDFFRVCAYVFGCVCVCLWIYRRVRVCVCVCVCVCVRVRGKSARHSEP